MLDYFPNADHAGIYAVQKTDRFRDAGLDVKLLTPSDPSSPLKLLAAGKVDVAISYQSELLLARSQGMELISIGAIVQKPLSSIVSLPKAKINSPKDLVGKRIGKSSIPFETAYLKVMMEEVGAQLSDIRAIDVGYNLVPALLAGKVDAAMGMYWNYEVIELERQGKRPHVMRLDELGVPTYNELIFVVRKQDIATRGPRLRRFMQAVTDGYMTLRDDPRTAVDALLQANPDLSRGLQLASIEATLPVFFPKDRNKPFGYQDLRDWQRYANWMRQAGLVDQPINASLALTNEFLPGQGL
jgi:putative hydroxymethylpyrimidine transport system substrate-binding protein